MSTLTVNFILFFGLHLDLESYKKKEKTFYKEVMQTTFHKTKTNLCDWFYFTYPNDNL
ncbi:hypothetical protein LEP1GSC116_1797 [Leptospira interrogans serovar Icterohaemorrhagiae str. Verdun HP]|uniref:Uncharacterized protein n=2 Tax=Leptospira interrogans TaxID=173 RepID=M6R6L7_LEPIR|nr:hypothetical protein LEP1GSC037_3535 [Leptospira interrogans str. 2006001854]EMO03215.1 hypothetical protein LEP1GSC116_1797 [Leptospira interrogans serovar Icterohaemorrhagiae str. Verdun HP]